MVYVIVEWAIVALLAAGVVVGVYLGVSLPRKWRALRRPEVVERVVALPETPTDVYRYYNRKVGGDLLYVGVADHARERAEQHAADKDWWPQVVHHETWRYPSRARALAVEQSAIHYEHPLYNKAPGGLCDAFTDPCPPLQPVSFRLPGRARARVLAAARRR